MYRVCTHELGGLWMLPLFETAYSTKQLYDLLEMCDVNDTLKKMAYEKAQADAKQKKQ